MIKVSVIQTLEDYNICFTDIMQVNLCQWHPYHFVGAKFHGPHALSDIK